MSTQDTERTEARSSVTLSKNAKGEMQHVVKLYEGVNDDEFLRILSLALSTYRLIDSTNGVSTADLADALHELRQGEPKIDSDSILRLVPTPTEAS